MTQHSALQLQVPIIVVASPPHNHPVCSEGCFKGSESLVGGLPTLAPETECSGSRDRKSTRLNSSHGYISYAVFCLKKKKTLSACKASKKICECSNRDNRVVAIKVSEDR